MIEYYNEDCMTGMARYPDKYFDLAIVDPPYGLGNAVVGSSGVFARYGRDGNDWDQAVPDESYFGELFRVSKNQIIWGGNYFALPPCQGFIVWRKTNIPEQFSMAMVEFAWMSIDEKAKLVEIPSISAPGERFHPTQKPVALYKWLLTKYAKPGDKILDTHVGSASSLVACHELGFDAVGFELDEDYYNRSLERLDWVRSQTTLGDFLEDTDGIT